MIVALKEAHLKVCPARVRSEVHSAPLDVEDPVGRTARSRSEDAAYAAGISRAATAHLIRAQIVPVREDRPVHGSCRQADIAQGVVKAVELQVAVGRDPGRDEGLVIYLDVERQTDERCAVVGVIAGIVRARHNGAARKGEDVIARCGCGRGSRRSRWY